jgi:SAM-dependent methyltransferase
MPRSGRVEAFPALPWDTLSRTYDRQLWLERSAVATAVELLDPARNELCLDLATGTGEVLRALARRDDPPREVIGVDRSEAMLSRVGTLPAGWSLRRADALTLPFDDGTFDAAAVSYLLHLFSPSDRQLALAELRRVLRPGGRLVTVTPAIPSAGLARPLATQLDRLARMRPRRYGALRALNATVDMQHAGFCVVASRWSRRGYPSVCVLAVRHPDATDSTASPSSPGNAVLDSARRRRLANMVS